MTARYPLVLNGTSIQELQSGDTVTLPSGQPLTAPVITGKGWVFVDGTTTSQSVAWGDTTTTYAQVTGVRDSSTTGHLSLYSLKAGTLTEGIRLADTGAVGFAGANYGTSGYVLTSNGSGSAPTWASANALPSQTGNSGKFLTTDGTTASWAAYGGVLTTPTLSTSTSANEGVTITVTISNYNASYAYNIAVTGGTYSVSGATITWTLPLVTTNTVHYVNVQATSSGSSSIYGTASVTVNDIPLTSDAGFYITDFNVNTLNDGWAI